MSSLSNTAVPTEANQIRLDAALAAQGATLHVANEIANNGWCALTAEPIVDQVDQADRARTWGNDASCHGRRSRNVLTSSQALLWSAIPCVRTAAWLLLDHGNITRTVFSAASQLTILELGSLGSSSGCTCWDHRFKRCISVLRMQSI